MTVGELVSRMGQRELNEWYKYLKVEKEMQKGDPLTQRGRAKKEAVNLQQWAAQYNANLEAKSGKK